MNISELGDQIYTKLQVQLYTDDDRKMVKLDGLPEQYPAYTIAYNGEIGVMVQADDPPEIDESFEGFRIGILHLVDFGTGVMLTTNKRDADALKEFAEVCSTFVEPGDDGRNRLMVTTDPFQWYSLKSKMYGNAMKRKQPSEVLAELCSLYLAKKNGLDPVWEGPNGSLVDIRAREQDIEVKSTIYQDRTEIRISRELQLDKAENDLHLYFVSLQESESGRSIEDMVRILVEQGFDEDDLEKKLSKRGYGKGKNSRTEKYLVTKVWDFIVDEDFPKIVPASFKNGKMPPFITKIEYTINVAGLEYKNLLK